MTGGCGTAPGARWAEQAGSDGVLTSPYYSFADKIMVIIVDVYL